MEGHVIVTDSFVKRAKLRRALLFSGWLFGAICLATASFMAGRMSSYKDAMERMSEVSEEQHKVTESFVVAWETQSESIKLISSWVEFIKEREEILHHNKSNNSLVYSKK